jgi:hypothetical protein
MKRGFKFALLFSTMITLSSAAVAQDVVLTEESIRAYVQEAAQSARGGSAAMVSFSEKHLHEDAVLKTVTRTVIPEMEPLEEVTLHSKTEFIEAARTDGDLGKVNELTAEAKNIQISEDGKSATVLEVVSFDMDIRVPVFELQEVSANMKATSECKDELVLSDTNIIQVIKADCNIQSEIQMPY